MTKAKRKSTKKHPYRRKHSNCIDLDLERIEYLASQGLPQYKIAERLGIWPETLTRKKITQEGVDQAIARGRAKFEDKLTESLYLHGVEGGSERLLMMMAKNHLGYVEAPQRVHITGDWASVVADVFSEDTD